MEKVDFFALPRTVQERIVGGIERRFPPSPLVARATKVAPPLPWLVVAGVSLLGLIVFHRIGYGSLGSGLAHHNAPLAAVYAGLFFGLAFGIVMALATYARASRLPYPLGVYAYGACVLDARSHPLRSYPLTELQQIDVVGDDVVLVLQNGTKFVFPVDPGRGATIVQELEADRAQVAALAGSSNPDALLALDPLHTPKFANPVGESEPMVFDLPGWVRFGWAIALGVGVVLGGGGWGLRNFGSDGRLFEAASKTNTPTAFRQYLAGGTRHRAEVESTLLPRAELVLAKAAGTVEALLEFEKTHPKTSIASEIQAAKRKAYLAELERAKTKKSLTALVEFNTKYPKHGLDAEYRGAIHELFAAAQAKFGTVSGGRSKDAAAALSRLLGYSEAHGPAIEIRFRRREGGKLQLVDKTVGKLSEYMGEISRPSRYFDDAHQAPRETLLGTMLLTSFEHTFPKEFVAAKLGELVADPKTLPAVTVPTMFITHFADWSGHTYPLKKPRGIFVGIFFNFEIDFVIPGDKTPFHQKYVYLRGLPAASFMKDLEAAPRQSPPIEEKVYDSMSEEARKQFEAKFVKSFFGSDSP